MCRNLESVCVFMSLSVPVKEKAKGRVCVCVFWAFDNFVAARATAECCPDVTSVCGQGGGARSREISINNTVVSVSKCILTSLRKKTTPTARALLLLSCHIKVNILCLVFWITSS